MNKCIFSGRLTADPYLRQTVNGVEICTFVLAVDGPKQKDKDSATYFLSMVAWRQKAEFIAKWLKKGSKVLIEALAHSRSYNKDGLTHYVTEFVVLNIEFAESKASRSEIIDDLEDQVLQNNDSDLEDLPF